MYLQVSLAVPNASLYASLHIQTCSHFSLHCVKAFAPNKVLKPWPIDWFTISLKCNPENLRYLRNYFWNVHLSQPSNQTREQTTSKKTHTPKTNQQTTKMITINNSCGMWFIQSHISLVFLHNTRNAPEIIRNVYKFSSIAAKFCK